MDRNGTERNRKILSSVPELLDEIDFFFCGSRCLCVKTANLITFFEGNVVKNSQCSDFQGGLPVCHWRGVAPVRCDHVVRLSKLMCATPRGPPGLQCVPGTIIQVIYRLPCQTPGPWVCSKHDDQPITPMRLNSDERSRSRPRPTSSPDPATPMRRVQERAAGGAAGGWAVRLVCRRVCA